MKKIRCLILCISLLATVGWGPFSSLTSIFSSVNIPEPPESAAWIDKQVSSIRSQAENIDQTALRLGLHAYLTARERGLDQKQILTLIDYSKPSSERRLWVIDLKKSRVLFNTWVSHGKNSGQAMANSFSNQAGSLKSSIGVFLTKESYMGNLGYALRLHGLEQGINNNAYHRAIVMHGAWYANPKVINRYGQIGRSWGCLAVNPTIVRSLVNTIREKTLIVVYYPDKHWLNHSTFLARK